MMRNGGKPGRKMNKTANSPPSGEVGFRAMSESLGWAKRPMLQRVHLLPPSMPVSMLYGARSWVDSSSGERVAQIRKQAPTKVLVSSSQLYVNVVQFRLICGAAILLILFPVCPLYR